MPTPTASAFALAMTFASALAQDPTPPAGAPAAPTADKQAAQRLQKVLATTAALPSCAFATSWQQGDKKGDPLQVFLAHQGQANGTADGTWSGDQRHLAIGDDELRMCGGRMLAKDKTTGWTARSGRFADGNRVGFVPDPQRLLAALLAMDLAVVHREAASLDDRPVEIATASLTHDQYAELLWNDLLPEGGGGGPMMIAMAAGGGAGARTAAKKPEATVDVAFTFDPSTGLLQRLHVRSYCKNERFVAGGGGGVVFVAGAGGAVVRGGGGQNADKDDDDEAEKRDAGAPHYVDGLPQRPTKNLAVLDVVIDLKQHGAAKLPELDERAQQLLRR